MINLFGITIHIYGLLIGLAIWVAWEVALKVAARKGIEAKIIDGLAWWAILGGIIGARVYHVIDLWKRYYSYQPIKVFYVWEGGLGIWGAIIGGVLGLLIYQSIMRYLHKYNSINILNIVDCIVVGLPLAQAIGRMGNWVNNELVGRNGQPLFAYEAVLNSVLFYLLWQKSKQKNEKGQLTGMYLIGYGLIRMLLENFRAEQNIWRISSIPVAVVVGFVSVLIGVYLYLSPRRNSSPHL